MTILLQRICWNSGGWRAPTGELFGQEDSYVGTNGFGHEEWNFATTDVIDGKVIGYSYYTPSEKSEKLESTHDIYFFAIKPNKERIIVGYYKDAKFLNPTEQKEIKEKFKNSEVLPKRIDELLTLNLPTITSKKAALDHILKGFAGNMKVNPENVFLASPHRQLTSQMLGGKNPIHINRYTKPLFLTDAPLSKKTSPNNDPSNGGAPPSSSNSSEDLPEDSYCRFTKSEMKVITRMHNQLSNRFKGWLLQHGCNNVVAEENGIDIACTHNKKTYLFELKTTACQSIKMALRDAVGQILDYSFFPGRTVRSFSAIVLDAAPNEYEIAWLKTLAENGISIEMFWLKGDSVFSSRITKNPLAAYANTLT